MELAPNPHYSAGS